MEKQQLRKIFEARYSSESWKQILSALFPARDFYATPLEQKKSGLQKHAIVNSIKRLGDFRMQDNSRIFFYEVELKKGRQATRNRVSLRNLLFNDVIPGDVDGILAVYYAKNLGDWRVSFISKSLYWDAENNEIRWETQPKRYTYVFGESEKVNTAIERFYWLFQKLTKETRLEDLAKAFSVEKISKEFFDNYKEHFEKFEQFIIDSTHFNHFLKFTSSENPDNKNEKAERLVRQFVKKLMGRVVFLYFLQKKGWLGVPLEKKMGEGERDFIFNLYTNCNDKIHFYSHCLVKLFFETLNKKRDGDIFELTGTKVPFLNGGLFDKDSFEPVEITFDTELWDSLFKFFNHYNFTIDENIPDDQDIGIDPEMLGLIFENLLEDNRKKGTYYTPKEVVHFMCKESLCLYISENLKGKATNNELIQITDFIKFNYIGIPPAAERYAADIERHLNSVKICDPAIGSGAFPVGMVHEILRIKKELRPFAVASHSFLFDYRQEKLDIIKNSIYGVDIDNGAVDIARLRFWLSLIVDDEEPSSLPNLDYKIMQGDSLKEYFEDIELSVVDPVTKVKLYEQLKQSSFLVSDVTVEQSEYRFSKKLDRQIIRYFNTDDQIAKQNIHYKIEQDVLNYIDSRIKFEENNILILKANTEKRIEQARKTGKKLDENSFDFNKVKKYKKALEKLQIVRNKLKQLEHSAERPYFLWHLYFSDVLVDDNGFDIVIGNPPYGVKVENEVRNRYKVTSKDSYGIFMTMALQKLLKPNGVLTYIVSDTWLTISSHFKLRQQILEKQLQKVIRLHQDCFKATVNSCIFTLINAPIKQNSENSIIAADLTNIPTRKQVPGFRDKIFKLESHIGESTPVYAVYQYPQNLLGTNSNLPVIVGSPKLFLLMNNTTSTKEILKIKTNENEEKKLESIKFLFNRKQILSINLADDYKKCKNKKQWFGKGLFKVASGIKTGRNDNYLRIISENAQKKFDMVDVSDVNYDLNFSDVRDEERKNGFKVTQKCYVPFEMGQPSDTNNILLPCYHQAPSLVMINWSENAVSLMKKEKHSDLANFEFRFINLDEQISFSTTGIYAPTFRIAIAPIFVNKSSRLVLNFNYTREGILGILNSKIFKYLLRNYTNHSVEMEVDDLKRIMFIFNLNESMQRISTLVSSIISKQKENLNYNFHLNEQKEIDRIVYDLYGLNEEDIREVETWFARRYPKLAKYADITEPQAKTAAIPALYADKWKTIIEQGENKQVEFKSTLRYCLREHAARNHIEHSAIKTIAAFLNSEGGTLLIGVEDNGNILGLDHDFSTFRNDNKHDAFLQHFDNLIQKYFGNQFSRQFNVEFPTIDGKTVCAIKIKEKSSEPVIINNPDKGKRDEFYVRRQASSVALTMYEFYNYSKDQWG